MPVATIKEVIEQLSKRKNLDEPMFYFHLQKEYLSDDFNNYELTDDNDNFLEVKKEQITDEMAKTIFGSLDNSDYVFERFNEEYDEVVKDVIYENIFEPLKELSEEQQLWDTEGDINES